LDLLTLLGTTGNYSATADLHTLNFTTAPAKSFWETIKVFSEYITFSVNSNVDALGGTTNFQTIFDFVPRCLKQVGCYRTQSVSYAGFQVLKIVDLNPVNNVLHIIPQEKIKWG
jgi:hypothetical protein